MTRGRKPKPAELKERLGNPGNRPIPASGGSAAAPCAPALEARDEVLPPAEAGAKAPEGLTEDAARFWREYTAHLRGLSWIKASDMQSLKRLCEWASIWWKAREEVDQHGTHYETVGMNGQQLFRPHPAFNAMRVAEDRCQDLEDRLGLNPVARQRIASQLAAGAAGRQPGLPTMEEDGAPASTAAAGAPAAASRSAIGALNRDGTVH
jgi:P27 family predicted phage terminase small subunit